MRAINTNFRTRPELQDFPDEIALADTSQLRFSDNPNIRREAERQCAQRQNSSANQSRSSSSTGTWSQWRPTLAPTRQPTSR